MTSDVSARQPEVDVIIPVYGERDAALRETLTACSKQTYAIANVFVVDDGSPEPVSLPNGIGSVKTRLMRLEQNQGISAARNAGIGQSHAAMVACVNTEILPAADWLRTCVEYLLSHPGVGACYTRMVPSRPRRLLTQWRMRYLEARFGQQSGPSLFAPGHAVVFRREALDRVGGYDVRYRIHDEDADICKRLRQAGWETHYVADSRVVSIQEDSLRQLTKKELRNTYWYGPGDSSIFRLHFDLTKWMLVRLFRDSVKLRPQLLPVDLTIWGNAMWIATWQEVQHALRGR